MSDQVGPRPTFTLSQAAARLNVKKSSLLEYVSRSLIIMTLDDEGKPTFDQNDVDTLAVTRRLPDPLIAAYLQAAAPSDSPRIVIESDITLIQDDELYFRGKRATELATESVFEDAVAFLWSMQVPPGNREHAFGVADATARQARRATSALGSDAASIDRIKVAMLVAGSHDPLRYDLSTEVVWSAGQRIISAIIDVLPGTENAAASGMPVAERLWRKLSPDEPTAADIALFNAALVLVMDDDLSPVTMAARVAASARANPYAAVTAALAAFDSGVRGLGNSSAKEMLEVALISGNAEKAITSQLNKGLGIPGYGHHIYRQRDPRAVYLLDRMRSQKRWAGVVSAADRITTAVEARSPRLVNMDLAIAALTIGAHMDKDAGQLIFIVARTAGWIAHILEEYSQPQMRLRP